ncbi:xanthine dehydrogenase molybdopterin binding subunit [Exilibacterium tricleocarpae]|uniref:Xanthine dehydrogenase molybdopterin binding subunit n=1 Tax=Exilibacterium tricleocarpae TaxID=2591008 RepID=A0A545U9W7_9GAMM|nr:xanthine dehydrogenase molybdopterin binding subunit [Exilibacterium tricleocarpae]TQV86203.1 xanthine dehydrogenase molybdopterin binding subunit [Exilibacterium tricleocarpae]
MRRIKEYQVPLRQRPPKTGLGKPAVHDSAVKHVTGRARYVDDMIMPPGVLHLASGASTCAHGKIKTLDLAAVKASDGVVAVFTRADVPGDIDVGPVYAGDPLFAGDTVEFVGQQLFTVAAHSYEQAQRAVQKAVVEYQPLPAVLTVSTALAQQAFVLPTHTMQSGALGADDYRRAIEAAPQRLCNDVYMKGQEHFYLEGQVCLVCPTEDGGVHVHTSSQHPTEVQKLVAQVLGLPIHRVQAEVRRMGGGFGGKESQAGALACTAAVVCYHTGRAVTFRLPRREDMERTGKRHDFLSRVEVGFSERGEIRGIDICLAGKCGYSPDLSEGIVDRAMFHADNAYYLGPARVVGHRCKTHTVSNTAFRGFGAPQGMVAIEATLDDIARRLGEDPLTIRKRNLYRPGFNTTHYGQKIEQHLLPDIVGQLENSSDYWRRRAAVTEFNRHNPFLKKGLALTPVKFGVSFTATHLNQAGALVHIYTDGSLLVNHAGTEMGQGLYTKVAQVVAAEFGVGVESVQVTATRTDKVANTSPTAASSGTDLNGMAARDAARQIKQGLIEFASTHFAVPADAVRFADNRVIAGTQAMAFAAFVRLAYLNRVALWSSGFYTTPKIHYDRQSAKGRPFFYFANGAAAAEVIVDTFTGEYRVERVDILHDVGRSINPAIDIGQIEGGFVQGMGWLTTEELMWDAQGRVIANSPANYKIPTAADVPPVFNVALYESANAEATIFNSKAVGEPPLMLAISVWSALRDACASVADYRFSPPLDPPATPERVLDALDAARAHVGGEAAATADREVTK